MKSAVAFSLINLRSYVLIIRIIEIFRGKANNKLDQVILYASGIIGSLFFAFTDTIWFNAVEAEVYSISLFFTALIFWLILVWHEKADDANSDKYILMIAYCVGLAIGVHLLNILALPAIGLIFYFRKFKLQLKTFFQFGFVLALAFFTIYPGIIKWIPIIAHKLSSWIFVALIISMLGGIYYAIKNNKRVMMVAISSFFLIVVGTSMYTSLYIRSNLNPAIDENNPENMENMVKYLNREQYGDWGYIDRRAPLWEYQIKKMYLRYFGWQFIGKGTTLGPDRRIVENLSLNGLWGLPFLVGLIGLYFHFKRDWKHASVILILFLMTGLAIIIYLNQDDPQPRERDYVYTGSFFAFAIWIGVGVTAILDWIKLNISKVLTVQKICVTTALILLVLILPINTIAINYHSHDRSGNYAAFDYSYNILQSCEPNAILFTNGDNDTFPLWFLQNVYGIRTDVRVANLSLLNTSWYIKQLKHEYPKAPISISDKTIDDLRPILLPEDKRLVRIKVPRDAYKRDMGEVMERKELITDVDETPEISFELEPTLVGKAIRVQDIMVLNIIQANQFRRPIYFALTVSPESFLNMDKYLRMDGLTFKVVTYPGEKLSASKLRESLMEKFQYRGLTDSTIYFNENIKGLLRNYQSAFLSLSQYYSNEKMPAESLSILDKLGDVMPDTIIPMHNNQNFYMGMKYYEAGRKDELKNRIDRMLIKGDVSNDDKLRFAYAYLQLLNDSEKAEQIASSIISLNPDYAKAYSWLLSLYYTKKQYDKGISLLNKWLLKHPDDSVAKQQIALLKSRM